MLESLLWMRSRSAVELAPAWDLFFKYLLWCSWWVTRVDSLFTYLVRVRTDFIHINLHHADMSLNLLARKLFSQNFVKALLLISVLINFCVALKLVLYVIRTLLNQITLTNAFIKLYIASIYYIATVVLISVEFKLIWEYNFLVV